MNIQDTERLKGLLAAQGYQLTKARIETFKLLIDHEPQTMAKILAKASGKVDRVTVYRNIDVFEKIGVVKRIYIGWKYKLELSDQFLSHHHHLSCLKCGKIVDIHDSSLINDFISSVSEKFSFHIQSHQLEMEGYCEECRATV